MCPIAPNRSTLRQGGSTPATAVYLPRALCVRLRAHLLSSGNRSQSHHRWRHTAMWIISESEPTVIGRLTGTRSRHAWCTAGTVVARPRTSKRKTEPERRSGAAGQFTHQPCLSQFPVAHYALRGNVQSFGGFLHAQAAEETQLDHARL